MEFQPSFIYLSVVGFVRGVVTITGTDAAWACVCVRVCGVVTQHDAVVSIAHGCQQTERKGVWENKRKGQREGGKERKKGRRWQTCRERQGM